MKGLTIVGALLGAVLFTSVAVAESETTRAPRSMKPPSSEAIAACKEKTAGQDTTITRKNGDQVMAKCRMRDGQLAAVPVPPQAAVDACKGKQVNDRVSFTIPSGRSVNAVCQQIDGAMVGVPMKHLEGERKKSKKGHDHD